MVMHIFVECTAKAITCQGTVHYSSAKRNGARLDVPGVLIEAIYTPATQQIWVAMHWRTTRGVSLPCTVHFPDRIHFPFPRDAQRPHRPCRVRKFERLWNGVRGQVFRDRLCVFARRRLTLPVLRAMERKPRHCLLRPSNRRKLLPWNDVIATGDLQTGCTWPSTIISN